MDENKAPMDTTYKVPAIEQAIHVMLFLANSGSNSKSLTDICREVGIHRSKAYSILNTLNEHGLVKNLQMRLRFEFSLNLGELLICNEKTWVRWCRVIEGRLNLFHRNIPECWLCNGIRTYT